MSESRDRVYTFVNRTARLARQAISRNPQEHRFYSAVTGGSDEDVYLHNLLNDVEDDRAHAEAVKLRQRGTELTRSGPGTLGQPMGAALIVESFAMDPYEERDGVLVRKSDGKPVGSLRG